jgi:hypothetical protein
VTSFQECEVAERFLGHADEDSFDALFRTFSPQVVALFAGGAMKEHPRKTWPRK